MDRIWDIDGTSSYPPYSKDPIPQCGRCWRPPSTGACVCRYDEEGSSEMGIFYRGAWVPLRWLKAQKANAVPGRRWGFTFSELYALHGIAALEVRPGEPYAGLAKRTETIIQISRCESWESIYCEIGWNECHFLLGCLHRRSNGNKIDPLAVKLIQYGDKPRTALKAG